jgi:rhodanese-related sulfurtransferase
MSDITVTDAHARWSAGELNIVDVREQNEHDATRVEGLPLIPMGEIIERIDELPKGPLAILCRSGNRSGKVADHLNAAGEHGDVLNVEGGILAWAAEGLPYEGEVPR